MNDVERVLSDPMFSELYIQHGMDAVRRAGWFNDGLNMADSYATWLPSFLSIPVDKIKVFGDNPVVLLMTGCFAPVHDGHISAMNVARMALESRGYNVCGGYFAPCNDDYVFTKPDGINYPAWKRLDILGKRLEQDDISWCDIDPYEALYSSAGMNFTDVYRHLEQYLQTNIDTRIRVVFCCGMDNIDFATVFDTPIVCVHRNTDNSGNYDNVIMAYHKDNRLEDVSSTKIRKVSNVSDDVEIKVALRYEGEQFYNWTGVDELYNIISDILRKAYGKIKLCHGTYKDKFDFPTINMDPVIPDGRHIGVSRIFSMSSYQGKNVDMSYRPEDDIKLQLSMIPKQLHDLVDDDIVSGVSIKFVKDILDKNNIPVRNIYPLLVSNNNYHDVIDCRDFIVGAPYGGLVTRLDNMLFRVPYMLPFVNLGTRAKIKYDTRILSFELWKANYNYHLNSKKRLCDINQINAAIFIYTGWKWSDELSTICEYYMRCLS